MKPLTKLGIVTLGCSKNTVDSEVLAALVAKNRVKVYFENFARADAVIINTCGFIGDSRRESVDTILHYLELKKAGRISRVFVMGCLVQRYAAALKAELPEVDGFFGVTEYAGVLKAMGSRAVQVNPADRILSTPAHYAYMKISEGCDRKCSFCAIPMIRGRNISRSLESLLDEGRALAAAGVRELNLIAQDTTGYGTDLYGKRELAKLLEKMAGLNLFEWIRLHYTFPAGFPADVLKTIAAHPSICRYIDIPLQHISDPILRSMKRGAGTASIRKLIDRIRKEIPGVAIRTAFIVGYPGETRAAFNELLRFIKDQRFERAGVFTFSSEQGTAAGSLTESVSERTRRSRADELMAVQQEISSELNRGKIGSVLKVLVDRVEGNHYIGRTEFDSPEVDNEVLIPCGFQRLVPGNFYQVKITGSSEFDLTGEAILAGRAR